MANASCRFLGSRPSDVLAFRIPRLALALGYPLKKVLHALIAERCPSILHDHGIWMPSNYYVAVAARNQGIPLLIHLHGMLEPWALQYRVWRKRIALRLYQRGILETATLFFATANQEVESIRRFGLKQPIAVIPNGVETELFRSAGSYVPKAAGSDRIVLFLGRRSSRSRGCLNLIEAWGKLRPVGWRLRLAGPDERRRSC